MFKTKKFPSKKAFTIVELVIVIAVIAILMGIMFIGGTAINNNAKQSTLDSDLRNYEVALKSFVNDPDNDKIVKGIDPGNDQVNNADAKAVYELLSKYLEDDMALEEDKFDPKLTSNDNIDFCATADSASSYSAKLKMLDPYGVNYQMTVLDNSTDLHTDIAYTVISYGKNKQTDADYGQGQVLDKDDVMLVVRIVDSVIYTGIYECAEHSGVDSTAYWNAVCEATDYTADPSQNTAAA